MRKKSLNYIMALVLGVFCCSVGCASEEDEVYGDPGNNKGEAVGKICTKNEECASNKCLIKSAGAGVCVAAETSLEAGITTYKKDGGPFSQDTYEPYPDIDTGYIIKKDFRYTED